MPRPSTAIMLYGTEEPVPESIVLRAGPVSAILDAGNLRYIKIDGREAIRAVSFVARSASWGTYTPSLRDMVLDQGETAFRVTYEASCKDTEQELRYRAVIEGHEDGGLRFQAEVEPVTSWDTMRTGFIVLHGVHGIAGEPATVLHTDGNEERSSFPALIKPSQPFFDMRSISHEVAPGTAVRCEMQGDAYEMEDQRNWSDASFKTYIRPLAKRPAPYTMPAGEKSSQSVSVEVITRGSVAAGDDGAVVVTVGQETELTIPNLGLAVTPEHVSTALQCVEVVKPVSPAYLMCHFDPSAGHDGTDVAQIKSLGDAMGAALWLEAVVPLRDAQGHYTADESVMVKDLDRIAGAVDEAGATFEAIVPCPEAYLKSYQPDGEWPEVPPLEALYAAVRRRFPNARVGGGMHGYFTELNRKRPPPAAIDFITHSTCPIVHAGDDVSVMESLESLPSIMASAKAMAEGRGYCIGPSAIGMRLNPYGIAPADNPHGARVAMARVDPRQRGLLNAAWTLGYLAHAARHGVDALALSAPAGEHGVAYARSDWAQPWFDEFDQFDQADETRLVYPVYHVLRGLCSAAGETVYETTSSAPGRVQVLAVHRGARPRIWLANLTAESAEVVLDVRGQARGHVRTLDETSFERLCTEPDGFTGTEALTLDRLVLRPYAVACVDLDD